MGRAGWHVSRRRVARLMRAAGLRAKAVRGYRAKASIHRPMRGTPIACGAARDAPESGVGRRHHLFPSRDRVALSRHRHGSILATRARLDAHAQRSDGGRVSRRRSRRDDDGRSEAVIFHSDRGSEYMGAPLHRMLARSGVHKVRACAGRRQRAHRIVLPLAQSRTHSRRRVSVGARFAIAAAGTSATTTHAPALRTRLSLPACLRAPRRVTMSVHESVSTRLEQDPRCLHPTGRGAHRDHE